MQMILQYIHQHTHLCRVLNEELKLTEEWVEVNDLVLNIEKIECVVIGSTYSSRVTPILYLTIGDIEKMTEVKL